MVVMTGPERPASPGSWRDAVDEIPPTVLVLGGFLTSPPLYRPFRARLLRRGAAAVVVANVWTSDWLLAPIRGLGPIVGRAVRALAVAGDASRHGPSLGAPVLIVGHSAGGIVGRILTAETPFAGRRTGLAGQVGAIASLGSPHHVEASRYAGRRVGDVAAQFADRVVPGAAFAPCVGYVTVASRLVVGRRDGNGRERVAYRLYQGLQHEPGALTIEGDGVVPVRSALLDGARHVILDDVMHGQAAGRPWYGADAGLDHWWPEAVDAWREALTARAAGRCPAIGEAGPGA
jgi:hypothetical protein